MSDLPTGTIPLDRLVLDENTQVRAETDPGTVKEYYQHMKVGAVFPPILVARVDAQDENKGFILIDGWHRVRATQRLGQGYIAATISDETDPRKFAWIAAARNMIHGLRLTRDDKRKVFKSYVKAGEHRKGRRLKSAREMSRDLGGIVSDRRIPEWMRQDFPSVFREMTGIEVQNPDADFGRVQPDERHGELASSALRDFKAAFLAIGSATIRADLLAEAQKMLHEVSPEVAATGSSPIFTPDEF